MRSGTVRSTAKRKFENALGIARALLLAATRYWRMKRKERKKRREAEPDQKEKSPFYFIISSRCSNDPDGSWHRTRFDLRTTGDSFVVVSVVHFSVSAFEGAPSAEISASSDSPVPCPNDTRAMIPNEIAARQPHCLPDDMPPSCSP